MTVAIVAVCTESNMIVLSFKSDEERLPKEPYHDFVSFSFKTIHRVTFATDGLRFRPNGSKYWRYVELKRSILVNGNSFGER